LFADWKRISLRDLLPPSDQHASLNSLLERWRDPYPDHLSLYISAVADLHTHRCSRRAPKDWLEFDDGAFTHMPIEILMLYRIREHENLENPVIEHPLMATVLGKLPHVMRCSPDDLLEKVLMRARSENFDDAALVGRLLG
jgi:hypothetical protein